MGESTLLINNLTLILQYIDKRILFKSAIYQKTVDNYVLTEYSRNPSSKGTKLAYLEESGQPLLKKYARHSENFLIF